MALRLACSTSDSAIVKAQERSSLRTSGWTSTRRTRRPLRSANARRRTSSSSALLLGYHQQCGQTIRPQAFSYFRVLLFLPSIFICRINTLRLCMNDAYGLHNAFFRQNPTHFCVIVLDKNGSPVDSLARDNAAIRVLHGSLSHVSCIVKRLLLYETRRST